MANPFSDASALFGSAGGGDFFDSFSSGNAPAAPAAPAQQQQPQPQLSQQQAQPNQHQQQPSQHQPPPFPQQQLQYGQAQYPSQPYAQQQPAYPQQQQQQQQHQSPYSQQQPLQTPFGNQPYTPSPPVQPPPTQPVSSGYMGDPPAAALSFAFSPKTSSFPKSTGSPYAPPPPPAASAPPTWNGSGVASPPPSAPHSRYRSATPSMTHGHSFGPTSTTKPDMANAANVVRTGSAPVFTGGWQGAAAVPPPPTWSPEPTAMTGHATTTNPGAEDFFSTLGNTTSNAAHDPYAPSGSSGYPPPSAQPQPAEYAAQPPTSGPEQRAASYDSYASNSSAPNDPYPPNATHYNPYASNTTSSHQPATAPHDPYAPTNTAPAWSQPPPSTDIQRAGSVPFPAAQTFSTANDVASASFFDSFGASPAGADAQQGYQPSSGPLDQTQQQQQDPHEHKQQQYYQYQQEQFQQQAQHYPSQQEHPQQHTQYEQPYQPYQPQTHDFSAPSDTHPPTESPSGAAVPDSLAQPANDTPVATPRGSAPPGPGPDFGTSDYGHGHAPASAPSTEEASATGSAPAPWDWNAPAVPPTGQAPVAGSTNALRDWNAAHSSPIEQRDTPPSSSQSEAGHAHDSTHAAAWSSGTQPPAPAAHDQAPAQPTWAAPSPSSFYTTDAPQQGAASPKPADAEPSVANGLDPNAPGLTAPLPDVNSFNGLNRPASSGPAPTFGATEAENQWSGWSQPAPDRPASTSANAGQSTAADFYANYLPSGASGPDASSFAAPPPATFNSGSTVAIEHSTPMSGFGAPPTGGNAQFDAWSSEATSHPGSQHDVPASGGLLPADQWQHDSAAQYYGYGSTKEHPNTSSNGPAESAHQEQARPEPQRGYAPPPSSGPMDAAPYGSTDSYATQTVPSAPASSQSATALGSAPWDAAAAIPQFGPPRPASRSLMATEPPPPSSSFPDLTQMRSTSASVPPRPFSPAAGIPRPSSGMDMGMARPASGMGSTKPYQHPTSPAATPNGHLPPPPRPGSAAAMGYTTSPPPSAGTRTEFGIHGSKSPPAAHGHLQAFLRSEGGGANRPASTPPEAARPLAVTMRSPSAPPQDQVPWSAPPPTGAYVPPPMSSAYSAPPATTSAYAPPPAVTAPFAPMYSVPPPPPAVATVPATSAAAGAARTIPPLPSMARPVSPPAPVQRPPSSASVRSFNTAGSTTPTASAFGGVRTPSPAVHAGYPANDYGQQQQQQEQQTMYDQSMYGLHTPDQQVTPTASEYGANVHHAFQPPFHGHQLASVEEMSPVYTQSETEQAPAPAVQPPQCRQCGTFGPPGGRFCAWCGSALVELPAAAATPQPTTAMGVPDTMITPPVDPNMGYPAPYGGYAPAPVAPATPAPAPTPSVRGPFHSSLITCRVPLAVFSPKGVLLTSFPKTTMRYSADPLNQPTAKMYPGPLHIDSLANIVPDMDRQSGPGPLIEKQAKMAAATRSALEWLDTVLDGLPRRHESLEDQEHTTDRRLLFQILHALISSLPVPSGGGKGSPPPLMSQVPSDQVIADVLRQHLVSNPPLSPADDPVGATALVPLYNLLLNGRMEDAVHFCLSRGQWTLALILSSRASHELWTHAVDTYVQLGLLNGSAPAPQQYPFQMPTDQLAVTVNHVTLPVFRFFIGMLSGGDVRAPRATDWLDFDVTMPKRPVDHVLLSSDRAAVPPSTADLSMWREAILLALVHRTPNTTSCLIMLGDRLRAYGRHDAAAVCHLVSSALFANDPAGPIPADTSVFGGPDAPTTRQALLGALHTRFPLTFHRDRAAFHCTELVEFYLAATAAINYDFGPLSAAAMAGAKSSASPPTMPPGPPKLPIASVILPHLQAFKLRHARQLFSNGHADDAYRYVTSTMAMVEWALTTDPTCTYLNKAVLRELHELSAVVAVAAVGVNGASPMAAAASRGWLSQRIASGLGLNRLDKASIMDAMGRGLDKFITGDASPHQHGSTPVGPGPLVLGPMDPTTRSFSPAPMAMQQQQNQQQQQYGQYDQYSGYQSQTSDLGFQQQQQQQQPTASYGGFGAEAGGPMEMGGAPMFTPDPYAPSFGQQQQPQDAFGMYGQPPLQQQQQQPDLFGMYGQQQQQQQQQIDFGNQGAGYAPSASPGPSAQGTANSSAAAADPVDDDDLGLGNSALKKKPAAPEGGAASDESMPADDSASSASTSTTQEGDSENGGGVFSLVRSLFGRRRPGSNSGGPVKANLGEENSFYYDKELKRWVNKKAGADATASSAPSGPPPPPPPAVGMTPPPMGTPRSGTPAPPPPSMGMGGGAVPPPPPSMAISGPPPPAGVPLPVSRPTSSIGYRGTPPPGAMGAFRPPSIAGSRASPAPPLTPGGVPPAVAAAAMAPGGPPPGPAGSAVSRMRGRSRYVDVFNQGGSGSSPSSPAPGNASPRPPSGAASFVPQVPFGGM